MDHRKTAQQIVDALGGSGNIDASGVCMTRLRISIVDPALVDLDRLGSARSVLGVARHGDNGLEVVFGPTVIDDVYSDFTAIAGSGSGRVDTGRPAGDLPGVSIQISPSRPLAARRPAGPIRPTARAADADELAGILGDLAQKESTVQAAPETCPAPAAQAAEGKRILYINGPNINMLGIREPDIYGREDYDALLRTCEEAAREAGFVESRCFQSNHEGDLVDEIQAAYRHFDGIVINPGAYTHTSVAILDAVKAVGIPCVEVHISKVEEREDFRQVSYIRQACFETVTGLGIEGYRKATVDMARHLGMGA